MGLWVYPCGYFYINKGPLRAICNGTVAYVCEYKGDPCVQTFGDYLCECTGRAENICIFFIRILSWYDEGKYQALKGKIRDINLRSLYLWNEIFKPNTG